MPLLLPEYVEKLLSTLSSANYEGYIVGGCVRDMLLGLSPYDYDITTNATPDRVKSLFKNTVDTGIKHGTVTVLIDGHPMEVTTFRTEEGYTDSRHPENVHFVSDIKEDLSRRDFTVNAMAYNHESGLIDYFGGKEDISAKILRTVGDPDKRFSEDALRILRLFRFSASLGFSVEKSTLESALKLCGNLKKISIERITAEIKKALLGDICALSPLLEAGGLEFAGIKPSNLLKIKDLPQGNIRLFAFLYSGTCDPVSTAKTLKLSSKEIKYIEDMTCLSNKSLPETAKEIKHILKNYDTVFCDFLTFKNTLEGLDIKKAETLYDEIKKNNEPYKISHLKISGNDLLKAGYKGGTDIGITLNRLLEKVIEDPEKNTKENLLELIK